MKRVAQEEQVLYIARENNIGFKAGNLRNAMDHTSGDFIVIFDADTRPFPTLLSNTLGYFRDPSVAWVQTPQWFYDIPEGVALSAYLGKSLGVVGKGLGRAIEKLLGPIRLGHDPFVNDPQMFYDIIKEATNATIPPMPGSSRFKGDIFNTIDRIFAKTELHKFENHLTFPEVAPFIEYVRASLSEDRKLWTSMFNGKEEYEALIQSITRVATRWFERDGKLVMTKVVGGFIATK